MEPALEAADGAHAGPARRRHGRRGAAGRPRPFHDLHLGVPRVSRAGVLAALFEAREGAPPRGPRGSRRPREPVGRSGARLAGRAAGSPSGSLARASRPSASRARAAGTRCACASARSAAARSSSGISTRSGPTGTLADIPFRVEGGVAQGPGRLRHEGGHRGRDRRARGRRQGRRRAGGRPVPLPDAGRGGRKRRLERAARGGGAPPRPRVRPRAVGRRRRREGRAQGDRAREGPLFGCRRRTRASTPTRGPRRSSRCPASRSTPTRSPTARRGRPSSRRSPRPDASRTSCPERAELSVDFRVWTQAEADRVMAGFRAYRAADPRVTLEIDGGANRPPMESTEASLALYRAGGGARPRARVRPAGGARRRRLRRQPHGGSRRADAGRPRPVGRRRARPLRAPRRRGPAAPCGSARSPPRGRRAVSGRGRLVIRELETPDEFIETTDVSKAAWGFAERALSPASDLVAATHAGGLTAGAFLGGKMLGIRARHPAHEQGRALPALAPPRRAAGGAGPRPLGHRSSSTSARGASRAASAS